MNDLNFGHFLAVLLGFCLGNIFQCWLRSGDGNLDNSEFFEEHRKRRDE
jgi:hypothetical protein